MDLTIRIKKVKNGFVLCYDDPEVRLKNRGDGPWIDPEVEVVFTSAEELTKVVGPLIAAMEEVPEQEHAETAYSNAFKEAIGASNV